MMIGSTFWNDISMYARETANFQTTRISDPFYSISSRPRTWTRCCVDRTWTGCRNSTKMTRRKSRGSPRSRWRTFSRLGGRCAGRRRASSRRGVNPRPTTTTCSSGHLSGRTLPRAYKSSTRRTRTCWAPSLT